MATKSTIKKKQAVDLVKKVKKDLGMSPSLIKLDGWINEIAGIGTAQDKTIHSFFQDFFKLEDEELGRMYIGGGLSSKIVDAAAEDATKEGLTLKDEKETEDDIKKIEKKLVELAWEDNFSQALKWSRLYGGGIIFVGIMDGRQPEEPVNWTNIKSIEFLMPIDRTDIEITTSTFYKDPTEPNYGKVETYHINMMEDTNQYVQRYIHQERVLPFYGKAVPRNFQNVDHNLKYWGASVFQNIYEQLRDLSTSMQSAGNILLEFIIGKYKITGLANMLSRGNEGKVQKRMEIINLAKSVINAVLLDADKEDYTRDTVSLGNLPETLDRFMVMLAAVTEYPVTRLFGTTPNGLSTDDESGTRTYYDKIRRIQKKDLWKQSQYLVDLICKSKEMNIAKPPAVYINKPFPMTEKEEAELEKIEADTKYVNAQTDQIYMTNMVQTPEEVQEERFPEGA